LSGEKYLGGQEKANESCLGKKQAGRISWWL
jgi:hypothetical protein